MRFSEDSLQKIKNIVAGFKNYPAYKIYDIASFCYDLKAGIQALRITKNGMLVNLWLFFPGINGEITSIAVYGSNLSGHLNAILSSMTVFGLPVESAEIESGAEDYIDIYLKEY